MNTVWQVDYTTTTQIVAENPEVVAQAVENFVEDQSGPLSSIGAGLIGQARQSNQIA